MDNRTCPPPPTKTSELEQVLQNGEHFPQYTTPKNT